MSGTTDRTAVKIDTPLPLSIMSTQLEMVLKNSVGFQYLTPKTRVLYHFSAFFINDNGVGVGNFQDYPFQFPGDPFHYNV